MGIQHVGSCSLLTSSPMLLCSFYPLPLTAFRSTKLPFLSCSTTICLNVLCPANLSTLISVYGCLVVCKIAFVDIVANNENQKIIF